uniref:CCR4-NOT transcription complex subunit 4 n=1 Tax=Meloidogyne javanica TaxID=6303 RepID=A0A915LVL5_MELJA
MSSDDNSDKECPLCMEAFDLDDFNFFPCNCQYQICRFCWHRIRTNENGLCPACRQSYPEDPVNFQPLSSAEVHKIKTEKKQKVLQQKNKIIEDRKHLSEYRVLQKNLVYAVGISQRMANPELLKKGFGRLLMPEFFGKFGKILKVAVGTAQAINNSTPPTHTAYVTFARCEDALRAIQAVNNMVVEGRLLKASLGTTKYCSIGDFHNYGTGIRAWEKKRPTSGSVENLPKLISQQIKQKKGNDDTVLTQKQQKPLTINGDQQQQPPPPNSSVIINSFVDDDDLGFDPFEESAKALKEIMQEEKQNFVIPQPSQQQIYMNGGDKYTINGTSSSSHTTEK